MFFLSFLFFLMFTPWDAPGEEQRVFEPEQPPRIEIRVNECCGGMPPPPPDDDKGG